jgi:hypothetical protein
MKLSRRMRRSSIWIAVFALLAMQVAVSAYACPYTVPASMGESGMGPDCASKMSGTDQPNLCKAHNDAPSQPKSDHAPSASVVAPFIVISLITFLDTSSDSRAAQNGAYDRDRLAPDGSPPLFLRLQVLRI